MIAADTVQGVIRSATERLAAAGIDTARLDAELLLSHVLECQRMALYGKLSTALSEGQLAAFDTLVDRRAALEPVAHITGEQEFWSLPFKVTGDTLIPRPDTETLVEVVLKRVQGKAQSVLDLGTGSGCILLSLLSELPQAQGVGVDISDGALDVARENARGLGLTGRVAFLNSNWFDAVNAPGQGFEVIVSNPPYIPSKDIPGLMRDVRDYEPLGALDGGPDGLTPYRLIAEQGPVFLAQDGLLAVEVGIHQAHEVAALFRKADLVDVTVTKDLGGIERVVSGKKS